MENDLREEYREEIRKMIEEIQDISDLKRIYTLVSIKHEKVL